MVFDVLEKSVEKSAGQYAAVHDEVTLADIVLVPAVEGALARRVSIVKTSSRVWRETSELDEESHWPSPRSYSRAYLHHLVRSGETLGAMLLSEINIAYYQQLMADMRNAIAQRTFAGFRERTRALWAKGDIAPR